MAVSQKTKKELIEENKALRSRLQELEHSERERKNAQDELRKSKEFLDNVVNSLDDSFFVKDQEHRWLMLNDAACALMGRPREELIGKSDYDLFSKEQADVFWEKDNLVFETGKTNINEEQVTWHGKVHTISTKKSLYTDPVTSKKFITGTNRDITERKKAEEKLSMAFRCNPDAIVISRMSDGLIIDVSEAFEKMFEIPGENAIGRTSIDLGLWRDSAKRTKSLAQYRMDRPFRDVESQCYRASGELFDVSISAELIEIDGETCILSVLRDITDRKKAEDALKTSDLRFRSLIEHTTDAVFCYEYDPPIPTDLPIEQQLKLLYDGVLVECNDVCAKSYGAQWEDEVVGRKLRIENGEGIEKLKDGTERYYLNNGHGVIEDGKLLRVWGSFRDITEQKKAKEALLRSERMFRTYFELGQVGMAVTSPEKGWIYVNDRLCEILGYPREELIQTTWADLTHPDDLEADVNQFEQVLAGKIDGYSMDKRFIRKDGRIVNISLSVACVRCEDGTVEHFIAHLHDITDRKRTEEALEQSENKYRSLIANIPDVVWTSDERGNTTFISENIKDIYGYSPEEIYAQSDKLWFGRIHPDDVEKVTESFKAVFEKNEPLDLEYRIKRKDDRWMWIRDRSIGAYEKDGVKYANGVFFDITERKKAQEAVFKEKKFTEDAINAQMDTFFLFEPATGKAIRWNKAFKDISGYTDREIARMPAPASYYSPEDLERAAIFIQKVLKEGVGTIELELICKDGHKVPTEYRVSLINDDQGEPKYFISIGRDITERKEAEHMLRENEERLSTIVERSPIPTAAGGLDGSIMSFNKALEELTGYGRAEIKDVTDWANKLYPDREYRDFVWKNIQQALRGEKQDCTEFTITHKDGSTRTVDFHTSFHNDGLIIQMVDITERKQAEEELRQQREKAQKYFDVAGVMFVVLDTNGQVRLINKKGCEVLGYKEEDIISKKWFDNFLPKRMKDDIAQVFNKLIAGEIEPVEYYENPVLTESGEERIIAWHNTLLRDKMGNITGTLSSGEDITENKRAEQALRQSEERFKILFESAPDAYYIHDLDGHFIDGNKAGEQLIGYRKEEVIGDNFVNLDLVAEEDIPKVLEAMAINKDSKPAGPLELTLYRKDGSKVMVETRSYPVEISGQTVVLGIARDITERKKAEVALRQSEQRLKILFQYAPDAIYLIDLKGNIVNGNKTAEKMIGYEEDELIGQNFMEAGLLSSEQVVRAIASLEKNAMGKPTGPEEFTLTRKDGSTVPVEIRTFPVKIGDQVLSLGIARDISARKKTEQKLFEHRAQLKSLASELSLTEERERHRLATDLHDHISQALVFSRIKLQELHASVSSAEIAGPLEEACNNLDRIIQDTRTLTFDLSSPILYELGFEAAVSEWLEEQIGKKQGVKTQFEDDGQPKPLEDDIRVLLFRNVRELLINIVKHADAKNVKVSIRRINQQIYVCVEDDGIGFNPAEVASNAGFGIFSIRERLEQLAGHIEIESEPGQGTKVTMTAPLKREELLRDDKLKDR
ncbi:MAG: PAS domain S-box protein [Planctomycetota bacterium]